MPAAWLSTRVSQYLKLRGEDNNWVKDENIKCATAQAPGIFSLTADRSVCSWPGLQRPVHIAQKSGAAMGVHVYYIQ